MNAISSIELSLFANRIESICEQMGAVLQRTAFSPNIKDRLDFSCAVFDHRGALCAQAAHIPVHMGSMAYAMRSIVQGFDWDAGDMIVLNDPFLGGTHLPDITIVAPVFVDASLVGFLANRAHHADIGSSTPGSMPISSVLEEEGIVISPRILVKAGVLDQDVLAWIGQQTTNQTQSTGDFAAQIGANRVGLTELNALVKGMGFKCYQQSLLALNHYAARLAKSSLRAIPYGVYQYADVMDDDGMGNEDIPIQVKIDVRGEKIVVDFSGTAKQTVGNINCPISVAAAGVYYVFRCLMPRHTPNCDGSFKAITIKAPSGSLINARYPAAVAAGNVETSMRVVDVVMGALAQAIPDLIPAASQGSMNNLAMGASANADKTTPAWDYYETIGGGMGAGLKHNGLNAVQSHMTNTRNTPIEVLEMAYPVRITRYEIRRHSGGKGRHHGGDGLIREYEFLAATVVTLLTERRRHQPWGLANGLPGRAGKNIFNGKELPGKRNWRANKGDRLRLETPGGGGWGETE